jgi:hypothetical protein
MGYTDDLAHAWKADSAGVIRAVDERRNQTSEVRPGTTQAGPFPDETKQGTSGQPNPRTQPVGVKDTQVVRELS